MLTTRIHRLDPSLIPEEQLVEVAKAFAKSDDVVLIDSQGKQTYLGRSRQFFVNLLENGEISHHRVGTHRRVTFRDLLEYERNRDRTRREAMDQLTDEVIQAGKYFPVTDPA